ncbi:HNH endonuclease [Streptomyces sp. A1-5]|uniref:HNH endonuclease n=1 Tax=Streptomyces sp. A1-5 TaxID=2738410 RepID=UPI003FA79755
MTQCQWLGLASLHSECWRLETPMTLVDEGIQRGKRSKQPTWVWLMTLTSNAGCCAYYAVSPSTTLEHEDPIADNGADTWWNFLPACKPCNDWKGKRTAAEWLIDQKLHRERPKVGFDTRRMPLRMFHGFEGRLSRIRGGRSERQAVGIGSATTTATPGTGTRQRCLNTWRPAERNCPAIRTFRGRRPTFTPPPALCARGTCAAVTGTPRQGTWTR